MDRAHSEDRQPDLSGSPPGVVVVNQHGDNRGDEAAMRAMVTRLSQGLPGAQFTIVHQFSDPRSEVQLDAPWTT